MVVAYIRRALLSRRKQFDMVCFGNRCHATVVDHTGTYSNTLPIDCISRTVTAISFDGKCLGLLYLHVRDIREATNRAIEIERL